MATTVIVESKGESGQHRGDWAVKKGTGRGASYIKNSSGSIKGFQDKQDAISRARQLARGVVRRTGNDVVLKVQNKHGGFRTEATYP